MWGRILLLEMVCCTLETWKRTPQDPYLRCSLGLVQGNLEKTPAGPLPALLPGAGPDSLSNSCGRCQYHLPKG